MMPVLAPGVPADIARDYVQHTWTTYSGTLRNVLIDHRVGPAAAALAQTGMPVRLLHGDRDTIAPLTAARALATASGWSLEVVAGGDHYPPVKRPASCAALLRSLAIRS
ncbi:MAG: alpha/beta hydrolase [Dehalococcoidia bacterium]